MFVSGRHPFQAMAAMALCFGLGACNHAGDGPAPSLEQSVTASIPTPAPSSFIAQAQGRSAPIASLPDAAGRVSVVHERLYTNGLRQDIFLAGSPLKNDRNALTILARTSQKPTLDDTVPIDRPTETMIRSEIGAAFPNLSMHVAERQSANTYGPYGLALGRAGDDVRCLYMWQWLDPNQLPRDASVSGPVSIRVHLCQAGTTFDAMAGLLDQLTLDNKGALAAASESNTLRPEPARPILAAVEPIQPQHRISHHKSTPSRLAHHEIVKSNGSQAQYLTSAVPTRATASAPQIGAVSTPLAASLPTDLPPEAYLGPKTSTTRPN